jgi:hypothetical protein
MSSSTKLTADERELLAFLDKEGEGGAYQINTWAINVGGFRKAADLQSLKRRGLVGGEGRGNYRQWWITEEGKTALEAALQKDNS